MSYSILVVKYNKDNHRFVALNNDCTGDSLLIDSATDERFVYHFSYGNFTFPTWSDIDPDEYTKKEHMLVSCIKEDYRAVEWENYPWFSEREPDLMNCVLHSVDNEVIDLSSVLTESIPDYDVKLKEPYFERADSVVYEFYDLMKKLKIEPVNAEAGFCMWRNETKYRYLQALWSGLCTNPVVYHYHISDHTKFTVYKGYNMVKTLYELLTGKLLITASCFVPGESDMTVVFDELPDYIKTEFLNKKLAMYRVLSGGKGDEFSVETLSEIFKF